MMISKSEKIMSEKHLFLSVKSDFPLKTVQVSADPDC